MLPKIIWFTGLSGSGKSTLSNNLNTFLKRRKYKILQVDGDIFRKKEKYKNNFTKKIIKILVSAISPLRITRQYAKNLFTDNYFEIFVNCSIKILKKRDTKGLYAKADQKKIKNLIGYKSKIFYERSKYKVILINTGKMSVVKSREKILDKIKI